MNIIKDDLHKRILEIPFGEITEVVRYISDSYTHNKKFVKKKEIKDVMNCFFRINMYIAKANKRYEQ